MPDTAHLETRTKLGIRWRWWQDIVCSRKGHVPSSSVSVEWPKGCWRPVCERCGFSVPREG